MAIDLYQTQTCTQKGIPEGATFNSLTVRAWCSVTSTVYGQRFRTVIKTHGTEYYGTWNTPIIGGYLLITKAYTLNPWSSSTWTRTEIDDSEVGIELDAKGKSGFPVYCTAAHKLISYEDPVVTKKTRVTHFYSNL